MILLTLSTIKGYKKILHYNPYLVYSLDYGKEFNLHTINLIPEYLIHATNKHLPPADRPSDVPVFM